MLHRKVILNAFRPGGEIDFPSGFAGRKNQVLDLVDAISTVGSCPVVYGERGLGKTSLAAQIARIAMGDVELLEDLGVADRALAKEDRFTVFWVNCSDETTTKARLLQRIINRAEGFSTVEAFNNKSAQSTTTTDKLDLKFITSETKKTYTRVAFSELDLEEQLLAVVDHIRMQGYRRVLFIIDEIDRMSRTYGLASFIKNTSDSETKFMLVGIADNISSLLEDHLSLQRHIHPVKVPHMPFHELKEIVAKVVERLADVDVKFAFEESSIELLAKSSKGFPWFVHLIGQDSLVKAWERKRSIVRAADVHDSIVSLASNRFAQEFSDKYTIAVGDSLHREIVVRVMARWGNQDIPLSEVYRISKSLGVTNPYKYKKDLEKKKHQALLASPQKGIVRFKNALFKRYVDLRMSIFRSPRSDEPLSELINREFDKIHGE